MTITDQIEDSNHLQDSSGLTKRTQTPLVHVLVLGLFIFFAEVLVMIILYYLSPMRVWYEILLDPVLLIIFLTPLLYGLVVRPLANQINQREAVETELIKSEERLSAIFNAIPDSVTVSRLKDGLLMYVNPMFTSMLKYTPEEALGNTIFGLNLWANSDERETLIKNLKEEKEVRNFETELRTGEGIKFQGSISASTIMMEGEECVLVVTRNITETKRINQELVESERRYRAVVETQNELIIRHSIDGIPTFVNDAYCRYFNKSPEEIIGTSFYPLFQEEQREDVKQELLEITPENRTINKEHYAVMPDGSITWQEWVSRGIFDTNDKLLEIQATGRDITENKRTQKALQTIAEGISVAGDDTFFNYIANYLAEVLEAEYVLIGECDNNLKDKICTIAVHDHGKIAENFEYDLAGTPCENVIAKHFCFYDDGLQQLFPEDAQLIEMGAESYIGAPIFDSNDQAIGIIAILSTRPFKHRDLAETLLSILVIRCASEFERKYAEEELKNLYQLSQQSETALRDSKAKLSGLAAEITIAEEQERRRIAVDMHDHIIQDLGLSKIKLGALAKRLAEHESLPLVEEMRELTELLIKEARTLVFEMSSPILYELGLEAAIKWLADETTKKSRFTCEVFDDGQVKPLTREMQVILFKAVRELMINITKYAEADQVNIFIDREIEQIIICVQDDGIGFTPANIDLYHDDKKAFGLFGIRERMDLLKGSVTINSSPGSGTSITLTAPLEIV